MSLSIGNLFQPLVFRSGVSWSNHFMLAPLTNSQSYSDGTLSNDEYNWLTYRAEGGFGLVMTCAAHVQKNGQGFEGQLGIYSDIHLPGLTKLSSGIKSAGSISSVQLHHAGIRSPSQLIGQQPVGASKNEKYLARGLSTDEVKQLRNDFISAAVRAETAGFDGVEIHGAHGYILCDFLSPEFNQRTDEYGGSLENRSRLIWEIIDGIREKTNSKFQIGLRISAERYGLVFSDQLKLARQIFDSNKIDYLDVSCWDSFKEPEDKNYSGKSLTQWFSDIPRGDTKLGVAGKLYSSQDCLKAIEHGADFPIIGRAAVLHHDFPKRVQNDVNFKCISIPVTREYLREERLGEKFINYMSNWPNFVKN